MIVSWKARYTVTIGSVDKREHDINIEDPTDAEILSSPDYKGNRENTRRYIVRRKADEKMIRFCNRLAIETGSPTTYILNSLDFMENGERKFSEREVTLGVGAQIGAPISQTEFLALEKEISTRSDDLLDSYADLYNRFLKSTDIFEKYILLYLIADKKAKKDLALRTIRNMLSHVKLDPKISPDKCNRADELFGKGVRTIDRGNPDHKKIVQDRLPELRKKAKEIIDELK